MKYRSRDNRKLLIFKLIAILLPFIFVLLAEGILRAAGYGTDLTFFKTDETGNYYYMNPGIGKRYFTQEANATTGNLDFFKKIKDESTFRIFVLGASTALGFPYMYNGTFPRMLKYRLQREYPEKNIEVINLSLSAINTYAVADMAKELANFGSDAVLIYAGQNEYHGTLGVASSSTVGSKPLFVRNFIWSKKSRLMQWIYSIVFSSNKKAPSTDLNKTLMERLASGQQIPLNSEKYKQGVQQFESNLNEIINSLAKNSVPVFIGTLVTNQKDLHPFNSAIVNQNVKETWEELYDNGKYYLEKRDTAKAFRSFLSAWKLDSNHAECAYQLGNYYYSKQNFASAKTYFIKAKELDNIRFRAPEEFNRIIRETAKESQRTVLVDVEEAFKKASPHGILGSELLLEHVHPNLKGYNIMADAFYKSLKKAKLLGNSKLTDAEVERIKNQIPSTQFDTLYGYISTILLKENWPFNEPLPVPTAAEKTYEGKIAGALAVKQIGWKEAMGKLSDKYLQEGNNASALIIAEGLCLEFPFDIRYLEQTAKLALKVQDDERYFFYLTKIWNSPVQNIPMAQQLFATALMLDKPDLALSYLNYAIDNTPNAGLLTRIKTNVEALVLLRRKFDQNPKDVSIINSIASAYLKQENYAVARKYASLALNIDKQTETQRLLKEFGRTNN